MVSSTKGNTGHLLGAAGAVEAIACVKAVEDDFVPPTINYKVPDEECDLDIVPNKGRNTKVEYAMSNSLGFGGHNSSIIFKKFTFFSTIYSKIIHLLQKIAQSKYAMFNNIEKYHL